MTLDLRLTGAKVLTSGGLAEAPLRMGGGLIAPDAPGREVGLSGFMVLPGLVVLAAVGLSLYVLAHRMVEKKQAE